MNNDELGISELEALVSEQAPEPPPDISPMRNSMIAYHLGVVLIDLVTGYTVGMLTFWYYGVIWFLGNAVVFFQHHKNWERAENNDAQEKNSRTGMVVSVLSMFVVALAAGGCLLGGLVNVWIQVGFEALSVSLFFFHMLQFALYRFADDAWQLNRTIAKARGNAHRKIKIIEAAGKVVEANRKALRERDGQYKKHGDRGAVDAAMARMEQRQQQPRQAAFAANAPKAELADKPSPTSAGEQK